MISGVEEARPIGQARRDIAPGESVVIALDVLSEIETEHDGIAVAIGPPVLDDESDPAT